MEHLDNHPYAFLNNENIVINVCLFENHDNELIEQVKNHYNANLAISCCEFGIAHINGDFYNNKFYQERLYPSWIRDEDQGTWVSPIPYPNDGKAYIWNESISNWEEVSE